MYEHQANNLYVARRKLKKKRITENINGKSKAILSLPQGGAYKFS
jgi:hypothetical protein